MVLILSLLNKLNLANDSVKNKLWIREKFRGYEIENKIIGIIGYGNTGKSLAKKLTENPIILKASVKMLALDKIGKPKQISNIIKLDYD